jgi:hypothetical protein
MNRSVAGHGFWKVAAKLISCKIQRRISTGLLVRSLLLIAGLPDCSFAALKQQSVCEHMQMPEAIPC